MNSSLRSSGPTACPAILEELYKAEVQGLTLSRVQGHGGEREHVETYRGLSVKMELSEKVRWKSASRTTSSSRPSGRAKGARTGEVGDGNISWCRSRRSFVSGRAKRTRRPSRP